MAVAASTTKLAPTALSVTPTAGSTLTLELYRNLAPNRAMYAYTEDGSGGRVTLQADPTVVSSTVENGTTLVSYKLGVKRIVTQRSLTGSDSKTSLITVNTSVTSNDVTLTEAQVMGVVWEHMILMAGAWFAKLVSKCSLY